MCPAPEADARSRQEQILLMAAEGLTDKEIAAKLGLSPETVGTYWRRILAKYSAASRTEVVAKVIRLQSEISLGQLSEVNECLREVTDHLLLTLSERRTRFEVTEVAILAALPEVIVLVDEEGFVIFSNAATHNVPIQAGEPLEWVVDREHVDDLRDAIAAALNGEPQRAFRIGLGGETFDARSCLCAAEGERSVIVSLRR